MDQLSGSSELKNHSPEDEVSTIKRFQAVKGSRAAVSQPSVTWKLRVGIHVCLGGRCETRSAVVYRAGWSGSTSSFCHGPSPAWGWSFQVCRHRGLCRTWAVQKVQFCAGAGALQWAIAAWAERALAAPSGLQLDWMIITLLQPEPESFSLQLKISGVEILACECGSEGFAHSSLCPARVCRYSRAERQPDLQGMCSSSSRGCIWQPCQLLVVLCRLHELLWNDLSTGPNSNVYLLAEFLWARIFFHNK